MPAMIVLLRQRSVMVSTTIATRSMKSAAMGKSVLIEIPVNNLDPEFNFFWQ